LRTKWVTMVIFAASQRWRVGRGEILATCGDVESNPGPVSPLALHSDRNWRGKKKTLPEPYWPPSKTRPHGGRPTDPYHAHGRSKLPSLPAPCQHGGQYMDDPRAVPVSHRRKGLYESQETAASEKDLAPENVATAHFQRRSTSQECKQPRSGPETPTRSGTHWARSTVDIVW